MQIASETKNAAAEFFNPLMKEKTLLPCVTLGTVVSDNAPCFTGKVLKNIMEGNRRNWRTALSYVHMSYGRMARMAGIMKQGVGRVAISFSKELDEMLDAVAFEWYRQSF